MVAPWWRHGGAMVVPWWRHGGAMVVSWWRHGGVMVASWWGVLMYARYFFIMEIRSN